MRNRLDVFVLFSKVAFIACAPLVAQASDAPAPVRRSVTGTVKDAADHPVPDAHLALETPDGKAIACARSDSAGHFAFSEIVPGSYILAASKLGLETTSAEATVGEVDVGLLVKMATAAPEDVVVIAKRLERARNDVFTTTGASTDGFSQQSVEELPRGENTPLNDVLLQAPAVAHDSFGQHHIRGDHANIQYRVNGIPLPEGVNGFAQVLTPRFANQSSLITGALPAEYGLRTAGVIDIRTRNGFTDPIADIDLWGRQRGTFIEPPTPGPDPKGGDTQQGRTFAALQYPLGSDARSTVERTPGQINGVRRLRARSRTHPIATLAYTEERAATPILQLATRAIGARTWTEDVPPVPALWPVRGAITSPFGWRHSPYGGELEWHPGIDIRAPYGTPVRVAADGDVVFAGRERGYGLVVVVRHGATTTRYAHLATIGVRAGQDVRRGESLGAVGGTGRATAAHLHYEVRRGGEALDPFCFLGDLPTTFAHRGSRADACRITRARLEGPASPAARHAARRAASRARIAG